jgi:hypothetical protein
MVRSESLPRIEEGQRRTDLQSAHVVERWNRTRKIVFPSAVIAASQFPTTLSREVAYLPQPKVASTFSTLG